MPSFKVEPYQGLDGIFNLDCFKFNLMKDVFHDIYKHLKTHGD